MDSHIVTDLSRNINNVFYFYPEMQPFMDVVKANVSEKDLKKIKKSVDYYQKTNDFQKLRDIGENHNYICSLIRNDCAVEFISYVNRANIPLSSKIEQSIFESNILLQINKPSLIEYAAFFGSVQIFQYLKMNFVDLNPKLWIYAIHGENADLIHLLEENHVVPNDKTYRMCYIECISCHHNEFAEYIKQNYLENAEPTENKFLFTSFLNFLAQNVFHVENDKYFVYDKFEYYNFALIDDDDLIGKIAFYSICKYDHYEMAKFLIDNKSININFEVI